MFVFFPTLIPRESLVDCLKWGKNLEVLTIPDESSKYLCLGIHYHSCKDDSTNEKLEVSYYYQSEYLIAH